MQETTQPTPRRQGIPDTQISCGATSKRQNCRLSRSTDFLRDIVTKRYFLTKTDIEKYVKDNAGYLRDGFQRSVCPDTTDRASTLSRRFCTGSRRKSGSRVSGTTSSHRSTQKARIPASCLTPKHSPSHHGGKHPASAGLP